MERVDLLKGVALQGRLKIITITAVLTISSLIFLYPLLLTVTECRVRVICAKWLNGGYEDMQATEISNDASRKKITRRALIIFVVMLVLLTFFSNTINNLTLPRVTVEWPMPGDIVKDISGAGIVEAKETLETYADSSAMVEEVNVKAGDHVKQGQIIIVSWIQKNWKEAFKMRLPDMSRKN